MAKATGATGAGRSWFLVQGLACGLLVATAAPLALVLVVVFAPALLVAVMTPSGGGRQLGGILLVYGLAAALPWLYALWNAAQCWPASLDLLGSMRLVAACSGAQAAAWLMGELVPLIARQVLEVKVRARIGRLRDARGRLVEEWGLEGEA